MSTFPILALPGEGEIRAAVLRIARNHLTKVIIDAIVEDDVDLDGTACLRITIVLKSGKIILSRGPQLGAIRLAIMDYLLGQGDKRFPYMHYTTPAELEESAQGE